MQTKKLKLATLLFTGALILAGCSSQSQSNNNNSDNKATTSKVSNHKSTTRNKQGDTLWDSSKDSKLKNFIDQWAPTMKQSYVKYNGTNSLKTSTGTRYPDDLSKVTIEGANTSIGWSKDGEGNYDYDVVAIYNYDGTVPPLPNHITYFFTFHKGQPIVLVDQSRDGTPNLKETENNDVKSAFSNIAAGKSAETTTSNDSNSNQASSNKSTTSKVTDPNKIGLMVYQYARPKDDGIAMEPDLGVYTSDGKYWIGIGTLASSVAYKFSGDTVTYYTKDFSGGQSDADAPLIPHDVSLKELEDQFYSTNADKQNVDSVADQMPAVSGE
ncbi:Lreu_0056 family protein [Companilactobacillus keshanensis]|uniref:DUF4767 domain-containing protein n=1 Tax=Companilactobacillus keshanensis TaxID=2486003 RepID=A0ABW4BW45_9LACO|nr:DUF4767 domain-containing protein [Companilactobacillus keshanensis]